MIPYLNRTVDMLISSHIEAKDVSIREIIDEFKSQHEHFTDVFEAFVLISPGRARITCKSARKLTAVMNTDFFVRGYPVQFENISPFTWVNVTRLSYGVPEAEITRVLSPYGEIKLFKHEQYSNVYTGVRNVLIRITTNIPARLRIAGHWCVIRYKGQRQVCFKCHLEGHKFSDCPQASGLKVTQPVPPVTESAASLVDMPLAHEPASVSPAAEPSGSVAAESPDTGASEPPGLVVVESPDTCAPEPSASAAASLVAGSSTPAAASLSYAQAVSATTSKPALPVTPNASSDMSSGASPPLPAAVAAENSPSPDRLARDHADIGEVPTPPPGIFSRAVITLQASDLQDLSAADSDELLSDNPVVSRSTEKRPRSPTDLLLQAQPGKKVCNLETDSSDDDAQTELSDGDSNDELSHANTDNESLDSPFTPQVPRNRPADSLSADESISSTFKSLIALPPLPGESDEGL